MTAPTTLAAPVGSATSSAPTGGTTSPSIDQAAEVAGHVAAARVDAGHELLAGVAALGEADRRVDQPLAQLGRDHVARRARRPSPGTPASMRSASASARHSSPSATRPARRAARSSAFGAQLEPRRAGPWHAVGRSRRRRRARTRRRPVAGHPQPGVDLALGWSSSDHAESPTAERGDVLAELALQVGGGVGAVDRERPRSAVPRCRTSRSRIGSVMGAMSSRSAASHAVGAVMRRAPGTAASRARALLRHSRSSCSGTLSATMPAPACTEARPSGRDDHGADGDGGVDVAGEVDVADDAGVGPALGRLELVDDLHGPHLRRARHGAGRQRGPQHVDRGRARRPARPTPAT